MSSAKERVETNPSNGWCLAKGLIADSVAEYGVCECVV